MKTFGLFLIGCTFSLTSLGQSYATDFTAVDCNGLSHNLFTELDAGKIIVIGWTMPCSSCTAPLLSIHNTVVNYAISNPGVVEYWLVDDYANTGCATVEGWATSNGINNAIYFSSSVISMTDYGTSGMPKAVVVGCSSHKVYYNKNNSPNGAGAAAGIDLALSDIAANCQLGTEELETSIFGLNCFPNPASSVLNVSFIHESSEDLVIELYSLNGALLKSISLEKSNNEKQEIKVNIDDLSSGFYLLKLVDGISSEITKIQVEH